MPADFVTETRELASEIKFLISAAHAREIRHWARIHLEPDPHAAGESGDAYQTTSVYFDTRDFDIYHRRGSFGRGKYRVRRYGSAAEVFLERKLRTKNLVAKRRSIVPMGDIKRLEEPDAEEGWPGVWFHRRLLARELHPVCQIAYLRTARIATSAAGPIRLTIDQDIQALALDRIEYKPGEGTVLSPDQLILELKYRRDIPAIFKDLIGTFKLRSSAVSKYRLAAEALGLVEMPPMIGESAQEAATDPEKGIGVEKRLAGVLDV